MLRRLRLRFILINMSIVTVMLCVIFSLVYHFTRVNLQTESLRMMQAVAQQPFQLGTPSQRAPEIRLPYFTLQMGERGELVAAGGGYYDLSDEQFLREIAAAAVQARSGTGVLEEYGLRYYRTVGLREQILVFADISSEINTLGELVKTCAVIGTASFFVFLGISLLLARWAVKPVAAAWRQQRQFVADASHELKAPLTVILTNAELLQSPEYDRESRDRFSQSILTVSRQMRALVEQMLELARADGGQGSSPFEPVDMSALTKTALLPFEPVFFEKGLHLDSRVEAGLHLSGDPVQLRQVLEILLDNAWKYSSPGGLTLVSLRRQGKSKCLLTVENQGDALSPEERKNVFKRFYRADGARSRTGSFGLGLSIAQSIVARHKGRIWAESGDGVNRFLVELPMGR